MPVSNTRYTAPATSSPRSSSPSTPSPIWEEASAALTRRVTHMQIYGDTGSGRTTLGLSAPGPIALLHCAENLEGRIQPFVQEGKKIMTFSFNSGRDLKGSAEAVAKEAERILGQVRDAWEDAKGWARTIMVDTDTDLYALLRLARFGKLTQVKPHHYGPVYAEWRGLYRYFREQNDHNLVFCSMMTEKYVNDKATGLMVPDVQKNTPYDAEVRVRTESNVAAMMTGGRKVDWKYRAVLEKAWYGADMVGEAFEDEMSSFPIIMASITGIDPEEWS